MKKANKVPVACPSQDEIGRAMDILSNQELHYYQLLYFNGLSDPSGNPVSVERCHRYQDHVLHMQSPLLIYPHPDHHEIQKMAEEQSAYRLKGDYDRYDNLVLTIAKHFGFAVYGNEDDKEILKKVKMMMDGLGKPILSHACCSLAKPRHCVCVASFECPIHGNRCVGSHD